VTIEPIGLVDLFRKVNVNLRRTSLGAESWHGWHALAIISNRAFRTIAVGLLLLEALNFTVQCIAVESIVLLRDRGELYDASFGWYTENVGHK
jgi:hypothetical protein